MFDLILPKFPEVLIEWMDGLRQRQTMPPPLRYHACSTWIHPQPLIHHKTIMHKFMNNTWHENKKYNLNLNLSIFKKVWYRAKYSCVMNMNVILILILILPWECHNIQGSDDLEDIDQVHSWKKELLINLHLMCININYSELRIYNVKKMPSHSN